MINGNPPRRMQRKSPLSRLKGDTFRGLTGVTQAVFTDMVLKCASAWIALEAAKKVSGRPHGIGGLSEHVFLMMLLYRCHITQELAGVLFGVDKGSICRALKRIEKIALGVIGVEKAIKVTREEAEGLIIDCTEQAIQRPKHDQKPYYSGKKKRHTIKTEVIIEGGGRIVSVSDAHPGSVHDLTVRRCSEPLPEDAHGYADSAYQGYDKEFKNFDYPYRKPRGGELTAEEKEYNAGISRYRVRVEHAIGRIKNFRMMSDRYRYPRSRHNVKMRIAAGAANMMWAA